MPKLTLFDLDGTLLHAHGVGMRAIQQAGRTLFGEGFDLQGVSFAGAIDPDIFQIGIERAGVDANAANEAEFAQVYRQQLEANLLEDNSGVRVLPGAVELIEQVADHAQITLGLLTGNYAETGPVKLRNAGLNEQLFELCVYGDDGDDRPALVGVAIQRYCEMFGVQITGPDVIVIGDTPKDIQCAKAHNCLSVAVATGPFDISELRDAGADLVLEDLSDPQPFWELIEL